MMNSDTLNERYVYIEGEQYGPYSLADIRKYLAKGRLDDNSMVWNSSLPDRIPLQQALTALPKESKVAASIKAEIDPKDQPLKNNIPGRTEK